MNELITAGTPLSRYVDSIKKERDMLRKVLSDLWDYCVDRGHLAPQDDSQGVQEIIAVLAATAGPSSAPILPASTAPEGVRFIDAATQREMIFCKGGEWDGWIAFQHPDKTWVTLRRADSTDLAAIATAAKEAS